MRKIITICIIGLFSLNVQAQPVKTLKLSDKELLDKIKGGWAGQTIGVVFGAPTEFKFPGTYIQAYQPIPWAEGYVKYWWEKKPGLFDDIYNDCTFVEAFDELGLDCSQEELAKRLSEKLGVSISQNSISKYEKETREPSNDTLIALSYLFNVSVDFLLGITDIRDTA